MGRNLTGKVIPPTRGSAPGESGTGQRGRYYDSTDEDEKQGGVRINGRQDLQGHTRRDG